MLGGLASAPPSGIRSCGGSPGRHAGRARIWMPAPRVRGGIPGRARPERLRRGRGGRGARARAARGKGSHAPRRGRVARLAARPGAFPAVEAGARAASASADIAEIALGGRGAGELCREGGGEGGQRRATARLVLLARAPLGDANEGALNGCCVFYSSARTVWRQRLNIFRDATTFHVGRCSHACDCRSETTAAFDIVSVCIRLWCLY